MSFFFGGCYFYHVFFICDGSNRIKCKYISVLSSGRVLFSLMKTDHEDDDDEMTIDYRTEIERDCIHFVGWILDLFRTSNLLFC